MADLTPKNRILLGDAYNEDGSRKRSISEMADMMESAEVDVLNVAYQPAGEVVLQDGTTVYPASVARLHQSVRDHAQATEAFTDVDGSDVARGARGYAQSANASAENASGSAEAASDSVKEARAAQADVEATGLGPAPTQMWQGYRVAHSYLDETGRQAAMALGERGEAIFQGQVLEPMEGTSRDYVHAIGDGQRAAIGIRRDGVTEGRFADIDSGERLLTASDLGRRGGGGGAREGGARSYAEGTSFVDHLVKHPEPVLSDEQFPFDFFFFPCCWPKDYEDGLPGRMRWLVGTDHASGSSDDAGIYIATSADPYSPATVHGALLDGTIAPQIETPCRVRAPGDGAGMQEYIYCHSPAWGNNQSTKLFRFSTLDPDRARYEDLGVVLDVPKTGELGGENHTGYAEYMRIGDLHVFQSPISGGGTVGQATWYSNDLKRWMLDPSRLAYNELWPDPQQRTFSIAGGAYPAFRWRGADYKVGRVSGANSRLGGSKASERRAVVGRMDPGSLKFATPPQHLTTLTRPWEQGTDMKGACSFVWQGRVHIAYVASTEQVDSTTESCHLGLMYEEA